MSPLLISSPVRAHLSAQADDIESRASSGANLNHEALLDEIFQESENRNEVQDRLISLLESIPNLHPDSDPATLLQDIFSLISYAEKKGIHLDRDKIDQIAVDFIKEIVSQDEVDERGLLRLIDIARSHDIQITPEAFDLIEIFDESEISDDFEEDDISDSIEGYNYKKLSDDRIRQLKTRIDAGDTEAKKEFTEANLALLPWVANKFFESSELPFEDLIQEGYLGLLRATELFDLNFGTKFSTYAVWHIRSRMARYISNNRSIIRIPIYLQTHIKKMGKLRHSMTKFLGRPPDDDELIEEMAPQIAKKVGIADAQEECRAILKTSRIRVLSLSVSTISHRANPQTFVFESEIPNESIPTEDSLAGWIDYVKHSSRCLTEREAIILEDRLVLGRSLGEIGGTLDLTGERIRQIEVKALKRLRGRLTGGKTYFRDSHPGRPSYHERRIMSAKEKKRRVTLEAFEANGRNVKATAEALGKSYITVYKRLRKYGVDLSRRKKRA